MSYVLIGVNILIGLLYTPFLLRMLGQSEYGLYSLAASVIAYLTVLDLGFGNAIVRYTAKFRAEGKKEEQYEMFGMFFLLYLGISLIAFVLALILAFNMAVATKYHFYDPFSVKALPILFLGIYIAVVMFGGGRYTIDRWLFSYAKKNDSIPLCTPNIAPVERTIRMLLSFVLCCIVFSNSTSDPVSILLLAVSFLLLVSSFTGYSLIYRLKKTKQC